MTPSQQDLPVEWVSIHEIRQVFNQGNYFERIKSGELVARLRRNSHLVPPPKGEPFCTHSQIHYYYTKEDSLVAVVHQYYRPDGKIGGSGLPDPKRLVLLNKIIAVRVNSP